MTSSLPSDITDLDASALSQAIHAKHISCVEVMQAYLARIHRLNPLYNAIVNLAPDDHLLAQATQRDAELARGASRGWLHGVPQAIKDTGQAAGFPTTFGCSLWKDKIAKEDGLMPARMKAAGCIVIGKTNMPEFGLGSHTFNSLFGATRNAWEPSVSAGGSSGGAAVALAQRMLPVADGSDFMGSLRNPAAWNHVFGLRPSQGRVPSWPTADGWINQLGTDGPMARTVADLARLLATRAGPDDRAPLSLHERFEWPILGDAGGDALRGLRIGWLGDLAGHLPMEEGLLPACSAALRQMEGEGAIVTPAALGFDPEVLWHAWLVWRRALVAPRVASALTLPNARAQLKPEALWEYDQAQDTQVPTLTQASETRTAFYAQMLRLFDSFDVLAMPVTQVWPFPIGERWPKQINGRGMDTYHRWMESTLYATFAGLPALSMPAGFHANGRWPIGLQLIGRPRGDAALLRVAAGYEQVVGDMLAIRP